LVELWRSERKSELEANWDRAQVPTELRAIEPLR
jgi:hypothetical protein